MANGFSITREIGIDMGHRVPTHSSKCSNLHGHRYTIQATCTAIALAFDGEQADMVLDFGFLKTIMMDKIDAFHDHGMTLWVDDPFVKTLYKGSFEVLESLLPDALSFAYQPNRKLEGFEVETKLVIVPFIPTAERLAEFWYSRMQASVYSCSGGLATLTKVVVWETPNCSAEYPIRRSL